MAKKWITIGLFFLFIFSPLTIERVSGQDNFGLKSIVPQQGIISACKNRINIPDEEMHWLFIPQSAAALHTEIMYAFLAGKLIANGSVDASACPAGGLGSDGYANACGLAVARPLVIQLQNIYDEAILKAWIDVGVPPVMLKQMIRYESQFWPGRVGEIHYGIGQMTYYGAHTALTWRSSMYAEFCALTGSCNGVIDGPEINAFLDLMNASCETCQYKIDIPKAQNSVHFLAEAVYAHCQQSAQIVFNITKLPSAVLVDYATMWKLTLMDYNVGPVCVYDAFRKAFDHTQSAVSWYDISYFTTDPYCLRGVGYANQITERFYTPPATVK